MRISFTNHRDSKGIVSLMTMVRHVSEFSSKTVQFFYLYPFGEAVIISSSVSPLPINEEETAVTYFLPPDACLKEIGEFDSSLTGFKIEASGILVFMNTKIDKKAIQLDFLFEENQGDVRLELRLLGLTGSEGFRASLSEITIQKIKSASPYPLITETPRIMETFPVGVLVDIGRSINGSIDQNIVLEFTPDGIKLKQVKSSVQVYEQLIHREFIRDYDFTGLNLSLQACLHVNPNSKRFSEHLNEIVKKKLKARFCILQLREPIGFCIAKPTYIVLEIELQRGLLMKSLYCELSQQLPTNMQPRPMPIPISTLFKRQQTTASNPPAQIILNSRPNLAREEQLADFYECQKVWPHKIEADVDSSLPRPRKFEA